MNRAPAGISTAVPALDEEGAGLARLAEGVFRRYGYDLRHFAGPRLGRRVEAAMRWEEVDGLDEYLARLLERPELMESLLMSLSGGPRPAFREPAFLLRLRNDIVPLLRTYPSLRIWVPGCGNGIEAYSLAVLLSEEGLYDRCRIYATDLSQESVRRAKEGLYPESTLRKWASLHLESGGKAPLSSHMGETEGGNGRPGFLPALRNRMVFAQHNLATDGSFNEFNLIVCRNVLPAFGPEVRKRAQGIIHQSLAMFGYLALGGRESPGREGAESWYQVVDEKHRIYRKVG